MALPLSVDPLVMYYNKSLFDSAFILDIPEYWDEVITIVPQLTERSANGRITLSGASLGTFDNIASAKELLSVLMIQNGNRIVGTDPNTLQFRSLLTLNESAFNQTQQALEFYTSFANINNANYSWNEALPSSLDMFIAGDLALYFGRASELPDIRRKNPNLDFDVALLPQLRGTTRTSTFGYMNGIAVSKQSPNIQAALVAASRLTSGEVVEGISTSLNQVPARIDLLRERPEEPYLNLFYNSAIIADAWVDPDPFLTDPLFRNLIRNINTGALSTTESINRAHTNLNDILEQTINTTIENANLRDF
jgi:ABC-type glycerol-3-phosphate transport system substrate-binding protein